MITIKQPKEKITGAIMIQGSKSLSNRYLVLKHVLQLSGEPLNVSTSEDTRLLISALETIQNNTEATIDIGHAGTDMRFLTALLSATPGRWILTGSGRMKERPIGELITALKLVGADIGFLEKENYPPLLINGQKLKGGEVSMNGEISSQFISAVLLSAPLFEKGISIKIDGEIVSRPYINMTIELMREFGINVAEEKNTISIDPIKKATTPKNNAIESDWSSASYWFSICALSQDAEITLKTFYNKSVQADSVLPGLFKQLGVFTEWGDNEIHLKRQKVAASSFTHDFTHCPDIAQTIAVTCFGLGINATLTGLKTLRIKETDRIEALKVELEKLGAQISVGDDFITLKGKPNRLEDAPLIETYGDHRMALSFAPLALRYPAIRINNPGVISKSYPEFWNDLLSVGFNVNLQPL